LILGIDMALAMIYKGSSDCGGVVLASPPASALVVAVNLLACAAPAAT